MYIKIIYQAWYNLFDSYEKEAYNAIVKLDYAFF